jgi:DNA-binding transcriptional MerR regulator
MKNPPHDTGKPLTIGRLARQFGLSRSTLLYYEAEGLLGPAMRTSANYRLYDDSAVQRLKQVAAYRTAGIPVRDIRRMLAKPPGRVTGILERQLEQLNRKIGELREQLRVVVRLLENREHLKKVRAMDKESWVALLRNTGLSEEDMARWHREFERLSPEAHRDFLESLGISGEDVAAIREWSKTL